MASSPFVSRYIAFLNRWKLYIVIFWVAMLVPGVLLGPKLLSKAGLAIQAPSGSLSATAANQFNQFFPNQASQTTLIVLLSEVNGEDVLPYIAPFTKQLKSQLYETPNPLLPSSGFSSFVTLNESNSALEQLLALQFVSGMDDNQAHSIIVITVMFNIANTLDANTKNLVTFVRNTVSSLSKSALPDNVVATVTGAMALSMDVQSGTEHDLLVMDGIAFPVALIVLAYVLRSFRLLIIPIFNMLVSILTAFLIALPIAEHMVFISYAPSLMMSITIAMSIDYSLFTLCRYREELQIGHSVTTSVEMMIWSAGHTILVSGSTLAVSFLGLCFFPVPTLRSPGLGTAIALVVTLTVNLTLTPSMLLLFNKFFAKSIEPFCGRKKQQNIGHDGHYSENVPLLNTEKGQHEVDEELRRSKWYKMGVFVTKYSIIILIIIVALAVPCAYFGLKYKKTTATTAFTPRNAESTKTYSEIGTAFGPGRIFSYSLLMMYANQSAIVGDPTFFSEANKTLAFLPTTEGQSPFYLGVIGSSDPQYNMTLDETGACSSPVNLDYFSLCLAYMSSEGNATFAEVQISIDPFSSAGSTWLSQARDYLSQRQEETGHSYFLAQGAASSVDAMNEVYKVFPISVGVTTAVVFLLIGFAFRSILIPLRSIITIAITLSMVYGCLVFVFEDGALQWLHIAGLSNQNAICWIVPVMAFSIIVGLGLDYDVFLLSRVVEYRKLAYTDREAILLGLTQTGSIITAAGAIMAVAFLGLIFSEEAALNELSFALVVAVLLDTLLIRSIVVPAIMSLIGKLNWWPTKMPVVKAFEIN